MAEKLETKPVEEPVKAKKKSLVVATVLGDLLFVEKLPDTRQFNALSDLRAKKETAGKTAEVAALDAKLTALSAKIEDKKKEELVRVKIKGGGI